MTQIDFYVQVSDKQETLRRLCSKARAAHARLAIWTADHAASQRLSNMLWSLPSISFLAHCLGSDPLAARTPIVLGCEAEHFPHQQILVNMRAEVPAFFSRFERLIEIVAAADEEEKGLARSRFRYYRDRGYEIRTRDMTSPSIGSAAQ